eukprot:GHVH01010522.1.p1 GENE.GHVH01010522.1~~GHVH01010522.1.p1  ORF type:complete len:446 (+),score=45.14 GHVH01010522.1:42-1340(+)
MSDHEVQEMNRSSEGADPTEKQTDTEKVKVEDRVEVATISDDQPLDEPHPPTVQDAIDAARLAASSVDGQPTATSIFPPATDPPLEDRPCEFWDSSGHCPSAGLVPVNGELARPAPVVGGVDYRQSSHPFKVFVGGVHASATESNIFDLFEQEVGTVMHVQVVLSTGSLHPYLVTSPPKYHKGYAFVTFQSAQLRARCLSRSRYRFMDRWMEVKNMNCRVRDGYARPSNALPGASTACLPQSTQDVPPNNKLFVALKSHPNIPKDSQKLLEDEMMDHFKHYGAISRIVVVKDKVTGIAKGYGFIYFQEPTGPQVALMAGSEHIIGENTRVDCKPFASSGSAYSPVSGMPACPTYSPTGGYPFYGGGMPMPMQGHMMYPGGYGYTIQTNQPYYSPNAHPSDSRSPNNFMKSHYHRTSPGSFRSPQDDAFPKQY